jgi:hypothetical protein
MGYVTYLDGLASSTATYSQSKFITLGHTSLAHTLLLSEFGDGGYDSSFSGTVNANGRNLLGSLRLQGGFYLPKNEWQIKGCTITDLQRLQFDALITTQSQTKTPLTLIDQFDQYQYLPGITINPTWITGYPITNGLGYSSGFTAWNVWVTADLSYKSYLGDERWLLQFKAEQC